MRGGRSCAHTSLGVGRTNEPVLSQIELLIDANSQSPLEGMEEPAGATVPCTLHPVPRTLAH